MKQKIPYWQEGADYSDCPLQAAVPPLRNINQSIRIMKKIALFLACAAILASCKQPEPEVPLELELGTYVGTVTVEYAGSSFDNENISVRFLPAEDGKTASIEIQKIKFVPAMPVTIDVTIPDVSLATDPEAIYLWCDNVIPLAMGGEYPRYLVKGLTGQILGDELSFSLKFGDSPTAFKGTLQR